MKNTFFINTIYVYKRVSKVKIHTIRTNIYRSLVIFAIIGIIYFIVNVEFYNTFILLPVDIYRIPAGNYLCSNNIAVACIYETPMAISHIYEYI